MHLNQTGLFTLIQSNKWHFREWNLGKFHWQWVTEKYTKENQKCQLKQLFWALNQMIGVFDYPTCDFSYFLFISMILIQKFKIITKLVIERTLAKKDICVHDNITNLCKKHRLCSARLLIIECNYVSKV